MQTLSPSVTTHYIFITDENGIGTAFVQLKNCLSTHTDNHVSLVYFSANQPPIFTPELSILLRHFPTQLIVYPETNQSDVQSYVAQQTLEAILNENTRDTIQILLFGHDEFVDATLVQLRFLGVEKITTPMIF